MRVGVDERDDQLGKTNGMKRASEKNRGNAERKKKGEDAAQVTRLSVGIKLAIHPSKN